MNLASTVQSLVSLWYLAERRGEEVGEGGSRGGNRLMRIEGGEVRREHMGRKNVVINKVRTCRDRINDERNIEEKWNTVNEITSVEGNAAFLRVFSIISLGDNRVCLLVLRCVEVLEGHYQHHPLSLLLPSGPQWVVFCTGKGVINGLGSSTVYIINMTDMWKNMWHRTHMKTGYSFFINKFSVITFKCQCKQSKAVEYYLAYFHVCVDVDGWSHTGCKNRGVKMWDAKNRNKWNI